MFGYIVAFSRFRTLGVRKTTFTLRSPWLSPNGQKNPDEHQSSTRRKSKRSSNDRYQWTSKIWIMSKLRYRTLRGFVFLGDSRNELIGSLGSKTSKCSWNCFILQETIARSMP